MTSQPLTPDGVSAKTTELYALSDRLLADQADLVESDFRSWVSDNFTLSTAQSDYLDGINDHAVNYFGAQCSIAFRGRLPIDLISPTPTPGYAKWITSKADDTKLRTNSAGATVITGSLTFEMEYLP